MREYSEQEVATILENSWKSILQRNHINEEDNFFLSGGDSLLASMLILTLTDTIRAKISLGDFYDNPTLRELLKLLKLRMRHSA